ncbi:dihydrolipoyl dehydrogenase family protein [Alkaliphilus hydrothermalis]|uniref:Pyruvate/2-oxoglutarate dehydrogenase complex dihydrolipoamide dehydrogenase (E3) component n=1 Tax=Alkaliphilus hydrothermalis TaxID=1482730 RepID=A0ABS2NPC1_9FIRM|nr:FAD-dependent oxidoreductase [Alkaliphilus hydrothermalis]MBM7614706.1 pyruvate/2-oxoglutarate dehydrogenase complex dihydrolipoamide dehydrogenase (E3) component [Alkaliphilus hydrothermalis]
MKYDYDIIVIGAGSAGLVIAAGGASLGAKVALVEESKMGGDCLNTGCVPSKTFLKSAHLAKDIQLSHKFGINASLNNVNLENVMNRVKSVIKSIEPHDSKERFEGLGVDVFLKKGKLMDNHRVSIGEQFITGKYIVIATGAKPSIPNIKGLDEVFYLTNENVFGLKKLPTHLIVLGGGPIGLELGQGFRHLGSKVTIIDKHSDIFHKDDPEVGPWMKEKFLRDGMDLQLGASILQVKQDGDDVVVVIEADGQSKEIRGDQLLVALGRRPSSQNLGLEEIGVEMDEKGYIKANAKLQTNIKNIYACGDVTGPYQFTHMAGYQASIVLKNIVFKLNAKVDYSAVPWTTYTKPEVSHVGYTEQQAKSLGMFKDYLIVDLADNDRAKSENDEGFIKLILGRNKRIIGATVISDKAGEMIPVVTLAIKKKLSSSIFLNMIFAYPTESEIYKIAALKKAKESFKDWHKKIIKFIFLR